MNILIDLHHDKFELWRYPKKYFEELKTEFPDLEFTFIEKRDDFLKLLTDADAIIGWKISEEDFPLAKNLKWYHTMAAGIGTMFFDAFIKSDVVLSNSAGVRAAPMADCVIGYIVSLAKRFPVLSKAQDKKEWARFDYWREIDSVIDLDKSTLGILGLGGIGTELAKRAKACGMRVIATKRHIDNKPDFVDELYTPDRKDEVLKNSDFVTLALPLTDDTLNIISTGEFQIMKNSAFLINVGRGKLVDNDALIHALQTGEIAGCALDVTSPEPPPDDSPLWTMDNVILTPHISGIGPNFWERSQELLKGNIRAFIDGKPLANVIDKKLQY
ncbi:MAG: D-2-hydroxyacid dehydrogenase [bacterium]